MAPFHFPSFTKTWHSKPYSSISPLRPELSVQGKTVIITGGGTGIGKAIAAAFAQAGASSVAIIGRREDRLKSAVEELSAAVGTPDSKVIYEVADLTDRAATIQAFSNIVKTQGAPIDICISNAGATPNPGMAIEVPDEEFMSLVNSNVRSTLNTAHAFIPRSSKNATLLNVSTGLIHMLPRPGISAHAASKAASMKLIEYIAAENPEVHVVSLQPGSVVTEATMNMKVKGKDDGKYSILRLLWDGVMFLLMTSSQPPRPLLRLARLQRSQIPQEQVCVGELGRQGVDGSGGGDSGFEVVVDYVGGDADVEINSSRQE